MRGTVQLCQAAEGQRNIVTPQLPDDWDRLSHKRDFRRGQVTGCTPILPFYPRVLIRQYMTFACTAAFTCSMYVSQIPIWANSIDCVLSVWPQYATRWQGVVTRGIVLVAIVYCS